LLAAPVALGDAIADADGIAAGATEAIADGDALAATDPIGAGSFTDEDAAGSVEGSGCAYESRANMSTTKKRAPRRACIE
jgi:hypothetical protein